MQVVSLGGSPAAKPVKKAILLFFSYYFHHMFYPREMDMVPNRYCINVTSSRTTDFMSP